MNPNLIDHLYKNWPLALIALGLSIYLAIVLMSGSFYTNQKNILKAEEPAEYWQWVRRMLVLDALCLVVLFGSFLLSTV